MNTFSKNVIKNPVQHSPWESSAPKGFFHHTNKLQKRRLYLSDGLSRPHNHYYEKIQRERSEFDRVLFKNLNMNLLTLTYPDIPQKEIETALTLCKNNLSESMKLLQRVTRDRCASSSIPLASLTSYQESMPKQVKYIPTKYSDVQIVEPPRNLIKNIKVEDEVFKMLQTYELNNNNPSKDNTITLYRGEPVTGVPTVSSTRPVISCRKTADLLEDKPTAVQNNKSHNGTPKSKTGVIIRRKGRKFSVRLLA